MFGSNISFESGRVGGCICDQGSEEIQLPGEVPTAHVSESDALMNTTNLLHHKFLADVLVCSIGSIMQVHYTHPIRKLSVVLNF